jgi:hypothetical protein
VGKALLRVIVLFAGRLKLIAIGVGGGSIRF